MLVANICIGLLGALIFVLGFSVSMVRGKYQRIIGCPEDPSNNLYKIIRAHANTAEYVPALMIMMYILSRGSVSNWLNSLFVVVTASRYLYILGMFRSRSLEYQNPIRFICTLNTYIIGFIMAVEIIKQAVSAEL